MIAQDTGSAIVGPARADLYFGAGADAGKVSGRLRHNIHFVMLVPKSLDPVARGRRLPIPEPRPSEQIAKLFPPGSTSPATVAQVAVPAAAAASIPLPQPRPSLGPSLSPSPAPRHEPTRRRLRYREYAR
jgi:membrane-bound lytic murein transglycosylase A